MRDLIEFELFLVFDRVLNNRFMYRIHNEN